MTQVNCCANITRVNETAKATAGGRGATTPAKTILRAFHKCSDYATDFETVKAAAQKRTGAAAREKLRRNRRAGPLSASTHTAVEK